MSKETDMLRKFASGCNENDIPSFLNLHGLRDRVAFAIEAVEAKIAEIVARVEKLEKMGRLGASPNGDDRTRGDMSPRGFDSPTPAAPTPPAPSAVPAPELWHRATQGFASSTLPTDMGQGPAAVPEPRGFRVGDVVRHREFPGEDWTVSEVMEGGGLIHCTRPRGWVFRAESRNLTLVRAADAPEAPKHMNDAVAGTSPAPSSDHASGPGCERANADGLGATPGTATPKPAPEAPAEEDTGLVVQRIRDEATKPLHVEIEKLRGEVARLTKERDEARAISAATAERVRTETQIATELRKDLADANDRLTSQSRSIEEMHAELAEAHKWRDDLRAKLAAAEQALDVERRTGWTSYTGDGSDLKPQVHRTIEDHHAAEQSWWQAFQATRKERDALRAELAAAQGEMRSLRATISVLRADLATLKGQRDAQTRSYDRVAAECDALRLASLTWFNEKGEPELLATAEEVTERRKAAAKELAALRAKPRFRTRKVTAADARALDDEWAKSTYVGRNSWVLAMNALGFRRRVDGDS